MSLLFLPSGLPTPTATPPALTSTPPDPWLARLLYPAARHLLLPLHFGSISVQGREHLPTTGPVLLAINHSSRWDALLVPYAAGWDVTGRHLRFLVSAHEMKGLQGWIMRRMGSFAVTPEQPAVTSLRHGVDLLRQGQTLVIFPEGRIFRDRQIHPLQPGLARIALHAGAEVQVVPLLIHYSDPVPTWDTQVQIAIGAPLSVRDYQRGPLKAAAARLTQDLQARMQAIYGPLAQVPQVA